jgi:hypothetical membrane protein
MAVFGIKSLRLWAGIVEQAREVWYVSSMPIRNRLDRYTARHPQQGPLLWLLSVQYFIVQIVVASDWHPGYSIASNTISDLGNTSCGQYGGRLVCSPLHAWMNVSFMVLGVTMITGSILLAHRLRANLGSRLAVVFMVLSGVGTAVVGIFPENTISALHASGAALPFVIGNSALILFACYLRLSRSLRYYTLFSGAIAIIACVLFVSQHYLDLGAGGMERLTAYPQTIWLIVFGGYLLRERQWPAKK